MYLHMKAVWRGVKPKRRQRSLVSSGEGAPFGKGRDPRALSDVLSITARDMGWNTELDQAKLITEWAEFAGETMAEHTEVIEIRNGVLQVQVDSTTWATELRRLRGQILTRILNDYPEAAISDLRFLPPGAPSWKRGLRSVQGRGPRDTYG
ncbi:MAG: DUF721 domain-containing protein [Leucobacter sp.]